jgi:hypothetical protein
MIPASETADPASGASAESWAAMLRARAQQRADATRDHPVQISSLSKSEIRVEHLRLDDSPGRGGETRARSASRRGGAPGTAADEAEHSVDLGNPMRSAGESSDPPSGASAYSWAQLLDTAGSTDAAVEPAPVRIGRTPPSVLNRATLPMPAGDAVTTEPLLASGRLLWHWLGGAALATAVCIVLWSAGLEPPQRWRQYVQQHLGIAHTEPDAETVAPP